VAAGGDRRRDARLGLWLIRVASELSAAPLPRIILAGQKVMRICLVPVASGAVVRGGMTLNDRRQENAMSVFSDAEIQYLASQRLGRLATVGHDGMPHVVPVAFRYNPDTDTIDIGGHHFAQRKKFRDVKRTGMAALVVDDVLPPWQPRAVEVRGEASTLDSGGKAIMEGFDDPIIRIRPRRIVSWGLEDGFQARSVG
jgi:pyridoxamine 5'-phosphate oxidase family protein